MFASEPALAFMAQILQAKIWRVGNAGTQQEARRKIGFDYMFMEQHFALCL